MDILASKLHVTVHVEAHFCIKSEERDIRIYHLIKLNTCNKLNYLNMSILETLKRYVDKLCKPT